MASRELQGWQPDPFGLHEMRYFSVGLPTKLVRDGRVEAYDEPPEDWSVVDAVMPATVVAGPVSPATTMPTAAEPGQSDPAPPTRIFAPVHADFGAAPQSPSARPRRRRLEYAFVAIGAVVAVLVFAALGGGARKPGIAPAAFVTSAAQHTLARHTADFTLSATAHVAGQTLAMGGSGQIDLAKGSVVFNAGASTAGGAITESELEVGGNTYVKIAVNGHSLPLSGGRQWIELPFAPTDGRSFGATSPDSSLALMSQQGARVTPLGSRTIGGQNCNGYYVTPSSQAMLAGARREFAKIGLPTAQANVALQDLQNVRPPTITAWFGAKTNLTCQLTFYMQFGTPAASGSAHVLTQLTFTRYGVPVNIAAPPTSDVVSIQQYLHEITKL